MCFVDVDHPYSSSGGSSCKSIQTNEKLNALQLPQSHTDLSTDIINLHIAIELLIVSTDDSFLILLISNSSNCKTVLLHNLGG
jgi:hypothetical protein